MVKSDLEERLREISRLVKRAGYRPERNGNVIFVFYEPIKGGFFSVRKYVELGSISPSGKGTGDLVVSSRYPDYKSRLDELVENIQRSSRTQQPIDKDEDGEETPPSGVETYLPSLGKSLDELQGRTRR
jgi:hypothetical protein